MKNMKRILLTVVAAMLLVVMSVAGTLAYLTVKTNPVTNTFKVGDVSFDLGSALDEGEIYAHDDSGRLAGAFGYANATGDIDGSPDNKMIDESFFFMKACKNLNAFIQDKKLQKLYKGLDLELEGVLLTLDKDEVKAEVVSGNADFVEHT